MPMSEHELKVLEQLEREFHPVASSRAASRWSGISSTRRLVGAVVLTLAGVLMVVLGIRLDDAGGVVLAAVGYLVVVGGVAIMRTGPATPFALVRRDDTRPRRRAPKYFR